MIAVLCQRHHIAQPGDSTDAIHAKTLDQIQEEYPDFWQRVALTYAAAAEATRPNVPQPAAQDAEDPDSAYQQAIGADA